MLDEIGKVISVSTQHPLKIRTKRKVDIEQVELGGYITIEGELNTYVCKIIAIDSREVTRGTADLQMQMEDISDLGLGIGKMPLNIKGGIIYEISTRIIRTIPHDERGPQEAKTVPPIFALGRPTTDEDVVQLFIADPGQYVEIGTLRGITGKPVAARIQLQELMRLHAGIFGKTGSGKTMLAKIILGHVVNRPEKATLVFDMHNEYGYKPGSGLKSFFPSSVMVVGIQDRTNTQQLDETIVIPRRQVTMGDVFMAVPSLSEAQRRSLYVMQQTFGREWFDRLMEDSVSELLVNLQEGSITENTLSIAQTEVRRFFDNLPFILPSNQVTGDDTPTKILNWLRSDTSVVVSFGPFSNDPQVYAIATNIISRRLLQLYRDEYDRQNLDTMPRVLIMLEEAHKFLNSNHLNASFFRSFVREARKFRLGLLIVDQSPSKIDEEVMSQLNTQLVMQLGNENDKRMVINLSEENLGDYKEEISKLNTREALVSGKASDFLQSIEVSNFVPDVLDRIWNYSDPTTSDDSDLPPGGI